MYQAVGDFDQAAPLPGTRLGELSSSAGALGHIEQHKQQLNNGLHVVLRSFLGRARAGLDLPVLLACRVEREKEGEMVGNR